MVKTFELGFDDVEFKKRKATENSDSEKPKRKRKTNQKPKNGNSVEENLSENEGDREPMEVEKENESLRVVVGIDFGTTYSGGNPYSPYGDARLIGVGVAWASNDDDKRDITILQNWRGTDERRDKVPTTVAVEDSSDSAGKKSTQWGYEIAPQTASSSWFKLKMGQNEISTSQDDSLLKQAVGKGLLSIPEGMTAEGLAQKYLRSLQNHVKKNQENLWGVVLDYTPIRYVLTVPADWGNVYKETLKRVANAAGIAARPNDTMMMVSEPEAAARAAFEKPKRGPTKAILKKDRNIVVIDMGGGTVDLITYHIVNTNPFRVREACAGSSAKCGGTSIDRALHELMGQKYGLAFSGKGPEQISHGSTFMNEFESLKRNFEGEGPDHQLSLKMDLQGFQGYNEELGKVTLTADEIAAMFAQVIDPSICLLSEQIEKSKGENRIDDLVVVLCGGLSGSPFVADRIRNHCDTVGAKMIIPDEPWSAIARGAVLYGLSPRSVVGGRKCRWSYGLCCHRKYDPDEDKDKQAENEGRMTECPMYGKRVSGCMKWHIKREETIKQSKPAVINVYVAIDKNQDLVGQIDLYRSRKEKPGPSVTSTDVEAFCRLRIDLSVVRNDSPCISRPRKNSRKYAVHIKVYQQVCFETEEVEFKAVVGRTAIGCEKVPYDPIDEMPN